MADTLLYQSLWENPNKPSRLNEAQWGAIKGQASELTPDKGKVWTLKLSKQGEEAYNGLEHPDDSESPLTDEQKLDYLTTTTREEQRATLSNKKRAAAQKKYQKDLDANAAKTRLNFLTDDELAEKFAQDNNDIEFKTSPLVPFNGYDKAITDDHKLRLQMKHINGIYHKQIEALNTQRLELASKLDKLRSEGKIDNAMQAQFEELGKQIETLNGKIYKGYTFGNNELDYYNKRDERLQNSNLTEEEKNKFREEQNEKKPAVAHLKKWLAARKKEFEEHNAAIDKEREDIENKINAESEVKDGDIELEHAVAKETGGYFEQVQEEGETARTRAQKRIIEKFQEAADKKDTRTMRKILEQHPDIAKKLGYDPVIQRKFNLRENTKNSINKAAERQETASSIKYTPEMKEDAVKAKEKYANMTDDDALEEAYRAHLGLPPTGKVYKTKAEVKAEKEYRRKQELNAQEQQAKVNASQAALKSKLNNINNLVKAGVLKPEQANTLARNAMLEFNASASAAVSKSPRTSTQAPEVTSKGGPRTFTSKGNTNAVGDIVKLRDAETAQKFDSLPDADKAAQLIRMGYDYSQLPQRYRNALDNSDYVNDSLAVDEISREEFDDDKDGIISQDEAKKHNIRVQTTYDESGNPIQVYRNRHTNLSDLDKEGVRNFFMRDEFNKGDFSRLQKRIFKAIGDQYTAEQKQQLAQDLAKEKLESEQRKKTYNTYRNIAEGALKEADTKYPNEYNVKHDKSDIDRLTALIEEKAKKGEKVTQGEIKKLAKAMAFERNKTFQYGKSVDGVSQDVYHRLASTLGSQYVNADENTKLALGQRFAQKTPELDKALELLRSNDKEQKKQGLELLRKLDSDWAKQSKGKDSEIMHPFRDDIYKFETDLLNEELAEMIKVNPARIGKAWNDYLEARKKGESLDKFSERFGGIPIDMPTTRGGRRRSGKWQAARGREEEYNNYIQNILPALQRYDQILKDLENRRIWSEELATKKKFQ